MKTDKELFIESLGWQIAKTIHHNSGSPTYIKRDVNEFNNWATLDMLIKKYEEQFKKYQSNPNKCQYKTVTQFKNLI